MTCINPTRAMECGENTAEGADITCGKANGEWLMLAVKVKKPGDHIIVLRLDNDFGDVLPAELIPQIFGSLIFRMYRHDPFLPDRFPLFDIHIIGEYPISLQQIRPAVSRKEKGLAGGAPDPGAIR